MSDSCLSVEIHGFGDYGFTLNSILAHGNPVPAPYLPGLQFPTHPLFADV